MKTKEGAQIQIQALSTSALDEDDRWDSYWGQ